MYRKLSTSWYLAVLALATLAFAVLAVALPHDPYIRYQSTAGTMFERTRYQYERLHFDPAPIDIVFIGSSRTAAGVDPLLLERDLAKKGFDLNVANLSLPASGMDIRVAQARDALASHPEIRLLVIPVVEQFPRDGHQLFGDLASTRDILASQWLVNRNLPAAVLRLPMRQMKLFAASALPAVFGYQPAFHARNYPGSNASPEQMPGWQPQTARFPLRSEAHVRELATETAVRQREIQPPLLPARFARVEFGVSRGSIEALVRLARANGTKIAFLYQPFYMGPTGPIENAWLAKFGPVWKVDILRQHAWAYRDAAHPSALALPALNAWLANQIVTDFRSDMGKGVAYGYTVRSPAASVIAPNVRASVARSARAQTPAGQG